MALDRIHLFESRTEAFREVLQESVITASHRLGKPSATITASMSSGLDINAVKSLTVAEVIDDSGGHANIRIPARAEDHAITEILESWPDRFSESGLRISTGPVVMFRAAEFLLPQPNGEDFAPLLSVFKCEAFSNRMAVSAQEASHRI